MYFSDLKIKLCGAVADIYTYERPLRRNFAVSDRIKQPKNKITTISNRSISAQRAKNRIIDLVNCNSDTLNKFITFTFKANLTDISAANAAFKKFIQRLRYAYGNDFKYVCVPEYQKRGAVHYHVLSSINFVHYTKLNKIWSYGYVDIKKIDNKHALALYVSKYMTKDSINDSNKKRYFCSRGLKKPIYLFNDLSNDCSSQLLAELAPLTQRLTESRYYSEFNGIVKHTRLHLSSAPDLEELRYIMHFKRSFTKRINFDIPPDIISAWAVQLSINFERSVTAPTPALEAY